MIWTNNQLEYLEENWGIVTLPTIMKNLDRTEYSIFKKVYDLNLGRSQYAGGLFYSPGQVAKMIGKCIKDIYQLIESGELKANNRRLVTTKRYQISLEDLTLYLKNNQDNWDSRRLEKYGLGIEYDWLKIKRRADLDIPEHKKKWTKEEERHLVKLVNAGYKMKDIAEKMGRTTNGIYQRTHRLRADNKINPTKVHLYWTDEEWQMVLELENNGFTDKEIAYQLGREDFHIVDKRRMMRIKGNYVGSKIKGGM